MNRNSIIKAIEDYSERAGLAPSTVCQYAVKNQSVYSRLKAGGSCSFDTADNLLAWMEENPPEKRKAGAA